MAAIAGVALIAGLAAAPAAEGARQPTLEPWRPGMKAARAYAERRAGTVSFAVRTRGRLYRFDAHREYPSASVVKAMLLVAYLNQPTVRGRRLGRDDRALLGPMIRRSRNSAATRVRDIVGNGALERLARRVGMGRFATAPSWGATTVTAADQAKLMYAIDRYVVARHRDYALSLLRDVMAHQRWGVGRVRAPGWARYFKGGWGDYGELDHQVALLRRGRRRLSLAILIAASPSHEYGTRTLDGVARRLLRGLGRRSRPR